MKNRRVVIYGLLFVLLLSHVLVTSNVTSVTNNEHHTFKVRGQPGGGKTAQENLDDFISLLEHKTGFDLQVGADGTVSIANPGAGGSKVLRSLVAACIGAPRTVDITVGRNITGVVVDEFLGDGRGVVDMDDFDRIPQNAPGPAPWANNKAQNLAHVLYEYLRATRNNIVSGPYCSDGFWLDFGDAHPYGIKGENLILSERGITKKVVSCTEVEQAGHHYLKLRYCDGSVEIWLLDDSNIKEIIYIIGPWVDPTSLETVLFEGTIESIGQHPAAWSGKADTFQTVTFNITKVISGNLTVGSLINVYHNVLWQPETPEVPQLAPSVFYIGNTLSIEAEKVNHPELGPSVYISPPHPEKPVANISPHGAHELFGPRLDRLLIKMYATENAEFTALELGDIDIIDSPLTNLTTDWITQWSSDPNIVLSFHGSGWKAYRKAYVGTPGVSDGEDVYEGLNWTDVVNQALFGVNSWGTFLSAHPEGYERGAGSNMTMRYGFSNTTLQMLNPIYSTSYWDWQILDKIYDTMIVCNPYELSIGIPWLAENYTEDTWLDPLTGETKTKISIALRREATWVDGTPLTVADVYFTLFELPRILETRGFPPPSWIANLQDIRDFKFLDPYNFEILLNTLDPSALDFIGENIILPKHIWKPIVTIGDPTAFAPDPNMTGSGPWRLKEYVAFSHILMVANRPGSAVQTNLPGSANITSPQGYWRYHPILETSTIDGATYVKVAWNASYIEEVNVTNLWYGGPITIDIHWRTTWYNGTVTDETYTGIVLNNFTQPGDTWTRSNTSLLKGRIKIDTEIIILELGGSHTTLHPSVMYATIKEDIAGRTFYEDIDLPGYPYKSDLPSPDIKVDMKDVGAAAKAFGSYPGHSRWNSVADINNDYKVDMKDIGSIAKKFGWIGLK